MNILRLFVILTWIICLTDGVVAAEEYPVKTVRIIIPFSAGSATDIIAREVGRELSVIWGQPVVAENLPGKGGAVAAATVSQAPPDGYTLFVHSSAYVINPLLSSEPLYNPLKDFTDIAPLCKQPLALVVGEPSSIKSVSGLIAFVKTRPGQFHYGSPGIGSAAHLTAEKFKLAAGINIAHVPFKGGPETIEATNRGDVIFSFLPVAIAKKAADQGKLRVLGVTSVQRLSALSEAPTIAEAGLAGFEYNHWWGLWGPAAMAESVVKKIEDDIAKSLAMPELVKQFSMIGTEPMNLSPSEFSKFIASEMESVTHIVKEAGIGQE